MGLSLRAQKVARELALAKQAERAARIREAERRVAEYDAEYLPPPAAARLCGFTPATLRRLHSEGRGPRPIKLGETRQARLRYPRSEVIAWLADRQAYEAATPAESRPKFTPPPARNAAEGGSSDA